MIVSRMTLMAHVELGRSNATLLKAVAGLAEAFDADVVGVAACQPIPILYGDMYASGDLMEADREEDAREIAAAEVEFRTALGDEPGRRDWRSAVTCLPLSDFLARQARAADLIVTSPDRGGAPFESTRRTSIANLVLSAGRPVLILPPETPSVNFKRVVIAWRDTPECRRAVFDALPFLVRAEQVTVIELAAKTDLADAEAHVADLVGWLEGHGVKAEARALLSQGDAAHQLGAIADQVGAGLVVAGAYGHTRLREWVLGGVTRDLLMHPKRCVLVSH